MIRKAKLSEIQEIIKITRACGSKMASEGILQWNVFYPNKKAFQKDLKRDELYVLLSEKKVIGCIVISTEKDSEYNDINWLTPDNQNYYIHRLAVHPFHQKKGYAKKLMDFSEAMAAKNNISSIRLDTFSQNQRNQKLYEARGYTRLGNIYFPKQSEHPFYCYELVLITN
jgi:ribosomal protein S18 acetylase RimI-like enzyme